MTGDALVDICVRAGLRVGTVEASDEGGVRVRSTMPARDWPPFGVVAGNATLLTAIHDAAGDVDSLWPGRDVVDGAHALLATALEAALSTRRTTPESVELVDGRWHVQPSEQHDAAPVRPGDARWRAAQRPG